jgi:3-methyladenine DNA glycosylase AlkD
VIKAGTGAQIQVDQAARQMIRDLQALGDSRKAVEASRFFKQPVRALGIDAPTLRALTRAWIQRLKPDWSLLEACELCELLLREPELETRAAGFLVLGGFSRGFDDSLWGRAETWLDLRLDNWALVDGFASAVLSPLLKGHPEGVLHLRRWIHSECLWTRRGALVTLVPLARRGEHLDLAFELCEAVLGKKEDLMHKALGWLLRETGKADPRRLRAFLLRHGGGIPRTSVRYAIERFPEEERKSFLARTRGA